MTKKVEFDRHAESYDSDLSQAISVSGEDKNYSARGRIQWLSQCLGKTKNRPRYLMDFGCGKTWFATPHLLDLLKVQSILGIDISSKSLDLARQVHGSRYVQFLLSTQYRIDSTDPRGGFEWCISSHPSGPTRIDRQLYISFIAAWRLIGALGKQSMEPKEPAMS